MREAAHDLRDRASVDAEIERSPRLAPPQHQDGVEDVAGGGVIAGELVSHSRSLTPYRRIGGTGLNESPRDAILKLLGLAFGSPVQAG